MLNEVKRHKRQVVVLGCLDLVIDDLWVDHVANNGTIKQLVIVDFGLK